MQFLDRNGAQQSAEWAAQTYGVEVLPTSYAPRMAVEIVQEVAGRRLLTVAVLDIDGRPMAEQYVALYAPDAPLLVDNGSYNTLPFAHADVSATDAQGIATFTLTSKSRIKAGAGPHALWILSALFYSDVCSGLGFMVQAGAPVGLLQITFRRQPPSEPPPVDSGSTGEQWQRAILAEIRAIHETLRGIWRR